MSRSREKLILASVAILVASSAAAETWRAYHNARFGATAEVPAGWKMDPPPENDDGRAFRSPDGQAEITISGILSLIDHGPPYKQEVASEFEPGEGETITYKKQGSNWIAVSGIKGGSIFYRKGILSCHGEIWNHLWIEYPAARKEKYDPLVTHVAASLHAGPGYWVPKCD
jgi:hypothetical protein